MRRFITGLLIVALCAGGLSSAAGAADPYSIHVLVPQTGPLAFIGVKMVEGFRVAEAFINEKGGIRGRPVKFVIHDDTSNPQVAVQLASQLMEQKVPLILGPALGASCTAVFALIEKNGPVQWCYSGIVRPTPRSFAFMYGPWLPDIQPVVVRYFYDRGARNFALVTSTDTSGQLFDNTFESALNRLEFRGAKMVAHERFGISDISVAAQVARIKAAKPDAIITFTAGTSFGTLLRGLSESGLDVPVYGSGANFTIAQMEQYSSFLPKELVLNGAQGIVQDPNTRPEVKRQQAAFFGAMKKAGLHVEYGHSLMWDITLMNVDAIRKLGPDVTAAQLHDYFENLRNWAGIQGVYNFATGDQRGLGEPGVALFRWNPTRHDFDMVATGPRYQ